MLFAQPKQATDTGHRNGASSIHARIPATNRRSGTDFPRASQLPSLPPPLSSAATDTKPHSTGPSPSHSSRYQSLPSARERSSPEAAESSSSTATAGRQASEYQGYASFFDGYASQASHSSNDNPEPGLDARDSPVKASTFNLFSTDEDEDLRDLRALSFTNSIRMNLEALSRSSADHYAYNADGYEDPNLHYGAKSVEETHDARWIQNSYAELISQLSFAQEGADHRSRGRDRDERDYRTLSRGHLSHEYREAASTNSSKDSPQTASLASGRSSSDANEDDLKTPPEPSLERFESSMDSTRYESDPAYRGHASSLYAQPASETAFPSIAAASRQADSHSALSAPQLGSPFQPSQPQPNRALRRTNLQEAFASYQIGDESEVELLNDAVQEQRRAAGKGKMMSRQLPETRSATAMSSPAAPAQGSRRPSAFTVLDASKPFTRLGPQDIAFSATNLPERPVTAANCVEMIVSHHPALCDAPLREFGEDGQPLPPTKKQETSDEERQARKEALRVKFCAKQRLSLIKAMVVMESRSAAWRRIGPLNAANSNIATAPDHTISTESSPNAQNEVGRLPPMPSPWSMEIRHEQLDVAQIKGKSKKSIELASLRTNAHCVKCDGSGLGACITCKSEQADECFWCSGTGREKTRAQAWCRRCQGAGILKCNTCHGSLKSECRTCEGKGTGEYGFFVDVTVKRVEMPAVPLATLFPQLDGASSSFQPSYDEVRTAATLALWDSITRLTEARHHVTASKGGKGKSKDLVPVMAACVWENSTTHVVAVDVPLAAKFKKGSKPALRAEGLHRKIPTQRRFFTVPNDVDLRSIELSEDDVTKIVHDSIGDHGTGGRVHAAHTPPAPYASSRHALGGPSGSTTPSPAMSSVDMASSSASLATPEGGASVSGFSTPSRVPSPRPDISPAKPAAREFVHRPSPLSQLAAATPAASANPVQTKAVRTDDVRGNGYLSSSPEQPSRDPSPSSKSRRPSAGHVLSKKLSSNILNKLGAHRGSV